MANNGELEIKGIEKVDALVVKLKDDMLTLVEAFTSVITTNEKLNDSETKREKTLKDTIEKTNAQTKVEIESSKAKKEITEKTNDLIITETRAKKLKQDYLKEQQLQLTIDKAEKGSKEQLSAQYALNTIRLNKMSEAQRLNSKEGIKLTNDTNKLKDSINKLDSSIGNHTGTVGKYSNAITQLPGGIGATISSMTTLSKTILLSPIGWIAGAVMLLYKAFMSTDSGANMVAGTIKALGNVIDIVLDRVFSLGKAMISLVKLDWEGFKTNASAAFDDIGGAIKRAATAGWDYVQVMDAIDDRESASLQRRAKLRVEIENLTNISKDQMKTDKERMNAAQEAYDKEIELFKLEKQFSEERNAAEIKNLASKIQINGMSVKDKEDTLQKWLAIDDLQLESELKKNKAFEDFYNKNEDEFKKVQKGLADELDQRAGFNQEVRRLLAQLSGFKKDLRDEDKKDTEKAAKDELDKEKEAYELKIKNKNAYDKMVENINKKNDEILNEAIQEQYDEELTKLNEQYLLKSELARGDAAVLEAIEQEHKDKLLALEIAHQQLILGAYTEGSTQYKTALKALQDLQVKSNSETNQKTIDDDKKAQDEKKKLADQYAQIFATMASSIGNEYAKLIESGDVDGKKFLKATISTALDALKALSYVWIAQAVGGSMASMQSIATAGIAGAIQAASLTIAIEAAVAAAKLGVNSAMGFAKGTKDAPGGAAIVGEKGREIITLPDGTRFLTPDHSTFLPNLPKHSEVTPANMVEQELRKSFENTQLSKNDNKFMSDAILRDMNKNLKMLTKKNTAVHIHGMNVGFIDMVNKRYRS